MIISAEREAHCSPQIAHLVEIIDAALDSPKSYGISATVFVFFFSVFSSEDSDMNL